MPQLIRRWSASQIIEYFIRNPQGKIKVTTADKNNWVLNTLNEVTIGNSVYEVVFMGVTKDIWVGKLNFISIKQSTNGRNNKK